jgi:hypothetical protein
LDLIEEWTDSLAVANAILNTFTIHIDNVNTATTSATVQLQQIDQSNSRSTKSMKSTIDNVAAKLEALAIVMDAELPAFESSFGGALTALDGAIRISSDFGEQGKGQIRQLEPQLLATTMGNSIENMKGFRSSLAASPRITTKLNRATRRGTSAVDRLIVLLEALGSQLDASLKVVRSV